MPNKDVSKLKNFGSYTAANQWKESLSLDRMTTREWNDAAELASSGKSDSEIRAEILKNRRK